MRSFLLRRVTFAVYRTFRYHLVAYRFEKHRDGFGGGDGGLYGAPPPFQQTLHFDDDIFVVLLIFSCRTSKFRHSLTKLQLLGVEVP